MPSIDVVVPENLTNEEETEKIQQPLIGIIYPPPEVRNIVDKTAGFVARNGPEFESRIRQNELGNPKFNFLNAGDPYHGYYQHRVKEIREGKAQDVPKTDFSAAPVQPSQTAQKPASQLKQQELLKQTQAQEQQPFVLNEPPPDFEYIAEPPSISAVDLDIVKLTAQFVARNGRSFLTSLMNREQRNYQFDFLRPQHSLFQYFTKLLEQYTKILLPSKEIVEELMEEENDMYGILDKARYRAEWDRHQEAQKRKEEQLIEKERIAYAQIDWHDFVVVETVDYYIGEVGNFPPPTTPDEVGARVLIQERGDQKKDKDKGDEEGNSESEEEEEEENAMQIGSDDEMIDRTGEKEPQRESVRPEAEKKKVEGKEQKSRETKDNTQVEDMEEESSDESDSEETEKSDAPEPPTDKKFVAPFPPLPPTPDKVIIKKGYNPKLASKTVKSSSATEEMISPLTGTKIPASKVQEHMRIGLLDPRWVEQRDKHIKDKMNQESVYAPGPAIEASLKQLAERRTDIFGIGDEETAIGKKIGEEDTRKDDKITWDGHTSSVEAATRAARANITIEDQIHQIHKVKGLLPDEEKEKIGPKPVASDSHNIIPPLLPPPSSKPPPLLQPPPKPAPLLQPPPTSQPKLPPPPPPSLLSIPTPAPPISRPPLPTVVSAPAPLQQPPAPSMVLLTSTNIPAVAQLPTRPPLMLTPQQAPGFPMIPNSAPPVSAHPTFISPVTGITQAMPQQQQQILQPAGKHAAQDKLDDEPSHKKMRTEDSLEPEHIFLSKHRGGPVRFSVMAPSMPDKSDWNLSGQIIDLSLPLTDSVAVIKAKIHELTRMPPGKQKLHWEGLFLKDSNSLAFYNISPSTVLHLQVKERGGRKK